MAKRGTRDPAGSKMERVTIHIPLGDLIRLRRIADGANCHISVLVRWAVRDLIRRIQSGAVSVRDIGAPGTPAGD